MPQLVIKGTTRTNQTLLDHGITDLIAYSGPGGAQVLYAKSGPNGGLTAYAIGADGALMLLDYAHFQNSFALGVFDQAAIIATATGPQMVVAQDSLGRLVGYDLAPDGRIDTLTSISGPPNLGGVQDLDQWTNEMVFLANAATGSIETYALAGTPQLTRQSVTKDAQTAAVFQLETVTQSGTGFLLGASLAASGVAAYRIAPGGLTATGQMGAADGLGVMTPTAMATAQIDGRHYIVLASAPGDGIGQSGAISVMQLRLDGSLWPTDHVTDTLHTRFGNVQSIETITAGGFTYVIAAGGDDGVTIFVLMPHGRLQMLDSIADQFNIGLENVTALAAVQGNGKLHIYAASEISAGVSELSFDIAQNGSVLAASNTGANLAGSALNDILLGGFGNDDLAGGAGDDIIEDGAGRDTLSGGAGRDIFVLRSDGAPDTITDFEPGRDRLDLSEWPFLYDPRTLSILPTPTGAMVTWRGESLRIETANGTPLSASDILAAIPTTPHRMPFFADIWAIDPGQEIIGTNGADALVGGDFNDFLLGLGGQDTLDGGAGDDTLNGGTGNDRLNGGDGNDMLEGEGGFDFIRGGDGDDTIDGGALADNLGGDHGNDLIYGQQGFDVLFGGTGDDTFFGGYDSDGMHGQVGNDHMFGDGGNDRMFGGHGFDQMFGGEGDDILNGGIFADGLHGDAGDDWLIGEQGFDQLFGGDGDDRLFGGLDADALRGGYGDDTLWGHEGNDRLFGDSGTDFMRGGPDGDWLDGGDHDDNLGGDDGDDTLFGSAGNDLIFGGQGNDRMRGGTGNDTLDGQWGNNAIYGDDGDDGDDIITARSGFDFIRGGNGDDLIDGGSFADNLGGDDGNDTILGGHGRDVLFGGRGNDLLQGGDADDRLYGQFGRDTIDGGAGNDRLWGGFDGDIFVFLDDHGIDTILDFNAKNGLEKIDLSGLSSVTSLDQVLGPGGAASQAGADVRIDTGAGNLIWLLNTDLIDLNASNFLF